MAEPPMPAMITCLSETSEAPKTGETSEVWLKPIWYARAN